MTVAEYMNLRCFCGLPHREHAHSYADAVLDGDVMNPHPTDLRVVGVQNGCMAFTWERERELGGNPLANKHLSRLMAEGD